MPIDLSASSAARRISARSGRGSSGDHDSDRWLNGAFSFRPRIEVPANCLMSSASAAVRAMIRLARCGSSVGRFRPATQPDALFGRRLPLAGRRGVVGDVGHEAAHATAASVNARDQASLRATTSRTAWTVAARSESRPACASRSA